MEHRTRDAVNLDTVLHNAYSTINADDESIDVSYDVLLVKTSDNPDNPEYRRLRDRHFVEGMLIF